MISKAPAIEHAGGGATRRRPGQPARASGALTREELLRIQTAAGNRAATAAVARAMDGGAGPGPDAVPDAGGAPAAVAEGEAEADGIPLDDEVAEEMIRSALAPFAEWGTPVINLPAREGAGEGGGGGGGGDLARKAITAGPSVGVLARSPGPGGGLWSGGVVGSVQLCYDVVTGDVGVVGWVWAGFGRKAPVAGWIGGYVFYEGDLAKTKLKPLFKAGKCDDHCKHHGGGGLGGGAAVFPGDFEFKKAGIEIGVLFTPHGACSGSIEVIVLVDLLNYLPVGTAAKRFIDLIKTRVPGLEVKGGIDGNGTLEACKDKKGNWVVPSGKLCFGGFVEAAYGVPRNKSALPH